MFILKWSIKHLRIHFVFEGYNTIHMDYWMDTEYFTAFRFNDREDFGVKTLPEFQLPDNSASYILSRVTDS
ncbi:unnamed protein product [Caenorhabditis brenneri]